MIDRFFLTIFFLTVLGICGCKPLVNKIAFHPDKTDLVPIEKLPSDVSKVVITTKDKVDLEGYFLPNEFSDWVLIYFHGNSGNIAYRIPHLRILKRFGVSVLGLGYRGYGASEGTPSEAGIYLDGLAALDFVTRKLGYAEEKVVILGRSLGTTVAVHTAQNKSLGGLVLITPLTTGNAQAKSRGFVMKVVGYIVGKCFDIISKVPNIKCPLLVVHGTDDEVIPYEMGKTVYNAALCSKEFITIKGGSHVDISTRYQEMYWISIRQFIAKLKMGQRKRHPEI